MRRGLITLLALVAVGMIAATALAGEWDSYKDTFDSGGFSGNDGSLTWSGKWKEIGESDGPKSGAVHVDGEGYCSSGSCLHLFGGAEEVSVGAVRYADTSVFSTVDVCYYVKYAYSEGSGASDAMLSIQVWDAESSKWVTIDSYDLGAGFVGPYHPAVNIDQWKSEAFGIRFLVAGFLSGEVFVDDVEIKGELAGTSTTTTTELTTVATERATTITAPVSTTIADATTTSSSPTTTTVVDRRDEGISIFTAGGEPPGDGGGLAEGSGLRQGATGIEANFIPALFGRVDGGQAFDPADITVGYSMAAEVIEASWAWMALLGLVIGWAIVSRIDRRRRGKRLVA